MFDLNWLVVTARHYAKNQYFRPAEKAALDRKMIDIF